MRWSKGIPFAGFASLFIGGTHLAYAQVPNDAQSVFEQALKEMAEKKYDSACPKLKQVVEMRPDGVGAKLELAKCYEAWGKIASASAMYTLTELQAIQKGQDDRATEASRRGAALKARLPTLTVEVPDKVRDLPKFSLKRDGEAILQGEWNTPVPLDIGKYKLEAQAEGYALWSSEVAITREGEAVKVVVVGLEPIGKAAVGKKKDEVVGPTKKVDIEKKPPPPEDAQPVHETSKGSALPVLGWVSLGLGVAGLGAGLALGFKARALKGDSESHCYGLDPAKQYCDEEGLQLRKDAAKWMIGSDIALIGGASLMLAGVGLLVFAPSSKVERKETRATARHTWRTAVGVAPGGIRLMGTW